MESAESVIAVTIIERRDGEGAIQQCYYDPISNPQEYSSSFFELRLLNDVTNNIVVCAVTFPLRAKVYYSNNRVRDHSYLQYMEKFKCSKTQEWSPSYWFLWCIIETFCVQAMANDETLCEDLCICLNSRPNKWALHGCTVKGYTEGFDGNEKGGRPICAAPKSQVQLHAA